MFTVATHLENPEESDIIPQKTRARLFGKEIENEEFHTNPESHDDFCLKIEPTNEFDSIDKSDKENKRELSSSCKKRVKKCQAKINEYLNESSQKSDNLLEKQAVQDTLETNQDVDDQTDNELKHESNEIGQGSMDQDYSAELEQDSKSQDDKVVEIHDKTISSSNDQETLNCIDQENSNQYSIKVLQEESEALNSSNYSNQDSASRNFAELDFTLLTKLQIML